MAADVEFALAQGVEDAQLFGHGARRQITAKSALAFEDFLEIKAHYESPTNCRSNLRQASTSAWRERMDWVDGMGLCDGGAMAG
ncbi:MAG: hypothetical protein ABSA47_05400 [Verrucomicrobiota bacterium]|jgi:hypothetical protein